MSKDGLDYDRSLSLEVGVGTGEGDLCGETEWVVIIIEGSDHIGVSHGDLAE